MIVVSEGLIALLEITAGLISLLKIPSIEKSISPGSLASKANEVFHVDGIFKSLSIIVGSFGDLISTVLPFGYNSFRTPDTDG